jgi:hypothetical protein
MGTSANRPWNFSRIQPWRHDGLRAYVPAMAEHFTVPVVCWRCYQVGSVVWTKGAERKLILVSAGFHESPTDTDDHKIACSVCEAVQQS